MFRVLIADDEHKVSLLIRALIHWEQLDLELVGTVDNGLDALEAIRQDCPDIVITDIRMPKMDGLEMIAAARTINERVRFIVISGYKQFEYAHSALRYGVEDYLLKPISENDLNATLQAVIDRLDNTNRQDKRERLSELEAQRGRSIVHNNLLERLLGGESLSCAEVNDECGLCFKEDNYQSIAVQLDGAAWLGGEPRQDKLVWDWITNRIRKETEQLVTAQLHALRNGNVLLWLFNYPRATAVDVQKALDNLILPLKEYISSFGCYKVTVGISLPVYGFALTQLSLKQAQQCLDARVMVGTGRRIYFGTLDSYQDALPDKSGQIDTALEHAVTNLDSQRYQAAVSELMEQLHLQQNGSAIYATARGIINRLYAIFPDSNQKELTEEQAHLLEAIGSCSSYHQLVTLLCAIPSDRIEIMRTMQLESQGKPVKIAKRYIEEHFSEKISLEDIASVVNLNPVYFSTVFKKETGENLTDYIASYRIEAAKRLLRDSNDTVAAVADKVGYKDVKYFSKLFAKIVGVNPAQYRKLYS